MLLRNSFLTSGNESLLSDEDFESSIGEIEEDTVPVGGDEIVPDVPIEEPSNVDQYASTMELISDYSELTIVDIHKISSVYPVEKEFPKCPVYVRKTNDNKLIVTAYITGPIEDNVKYLMLLEILELVSENDQVYLFIDSPGGMVSTGAVIASAIDNCKAKVVGIARGFCASAASLIWSACHVNIASPLAVFLYHMSSHFDVGNSESIRERAVILITYVREYLLKVALDKGHITSDEFTTIVKGKEDVIIPATVMIPRLNGGSES